MDVGERSVPDTATEADLLACFRLLYGRSPGKAEWRAGLRQVGANVRDLVATHLRASGMADRLPRNGAEPGRDAEPKVREAGFPGFRILADQDDAAVGRHVLGGCYEPEVTSVIRARLAPGMGVVDIGANIGYFTMLAASLVGDAGYVLAVEPNPRNARMIEASRRLNGFGHVQVAQVAAGTDTAMLALHSSYSTGTTSDVPVEVSAVLEANTVLCVRPDRLVPAGRHIGLIKVDVDGSDHKALLGCTGIIARDRPAIVTEFSPSLLRSLSGITGDDYLRWFLEGGYRVSIIGLDGSLTDIGNDRQRALDEHEARASTHIDLLALPG